MPDNQSSLRLSVVITIVSGKKSLQRCLSALLPQMNDAADEIIVPFDKWSGEIAELAKDFPGVKFHFIEDLKVAEREDAGAHQHRLYDRRRAVGLNLASGRVVAMTEDHAVPAADWCRQILAAHEKPSEVVGGAIENAVDRALNWAWYYSDFGRYGRPLAETEIGYVSDVNVSYKRETLEAVREVWREAYQETTVHWALQKRGVRLALNEKIVVYQHRPPLKLNEAWRERIEWGKIFAETRASQTSFGKRLLLAAGAAFLPAVLLWRIFKNMRQQKRSAKQIGRVLPLALLLLIGWSYGEFLGYLSGSKSAQKGERQVNLQPKKLNSEGYSR